MKKNYWILVTLTVILLAALLLPACAEEQQAVSTPTSSTSAPPPPPAEVKTIKISYSCPKGKGYSAGEEWFGPEFEKRTNGRYKVEVYGASTLVPITAVLDSVRKGVIQIGLTSTAQFAKDFPLSMLPQVMTLGWPSTAVTPKWYDAATPAFAEFAKIPEVATELNNGFTYGGNDLLSSSMILMKKKEIHVPADFKGTTMSAIGAFAEVVKANGGATVAVVTPEIYMNLDKGAIDGASVSPTMITDWKLQTIANYMFAIDMGTGNMVILYNNEFYNALPPADKKIFDDTRAEAWPICRDFMLNADKKALEILATEGKTIVQPSASDLAAWKKTVQEIMIPKWRADAKSVGISDAVLDKVYSEWLTIRAKYWKQAGLPGEP
jgi:TRAP-type C4-dicarboxylate transport system substrate-binding protein